PYIAHDRLELAIAVMKGNFQPAHLANPDVPLWLSGIISKLLSTTAADRFRSADDLIRALDAREPGVASEAGQAVSIPPRRWTSAAPNAAAALARAIRGRPGHPH